jgi:hypothetical protein
MYAAMVLKYRWFLKPGEDELLQLIIVAMLGCCAGLWALFPSRIAVGVIAALCFVAPALIDPEDYSFSSAGLSLLNAPTLGIFFLLTMLAVGIAQWRQYLIATKR